MSVSSASDIGGPEPLLAAIVQSSDDAILAKTLDGVITWWNDAAERLYGYTAEEAIGRPVSMLIPPERTGELEAIMDRIRAGGRVDHFETVRLARDGTPIDVSLTVSPIHDPSGVIVGASSIARDVRRRLRAERAAAHHRADAAEMRDRLRYVLSSSAAVLYLAEIAPAAAPQLTWISESVRIVLG